MCSRSCSAVTQTPSNGIDRDSERATSSSVGPISARWSSRTLHSTPMVERISFSWLTSCSAGITAMHSITRACGRYAAARRTMPICSTTFAMPNFRYTGSSVASGWMNRAAVPVVLATVTRPPPRSAPRTAG